VDIFAHAIAGGLLGRAVAPASERWKRTAVIGAVAGVSPDIPDTPLVFMGHEAWLQWHQLYTHSLVGLVWVPPLFALLFVGLSWRRRFLLAYAGWGLHVLLDVVANWPVPVPWPLLDSRWALVRLESDFSWIIDMIFIVGMAATLWEPAMKHARAISGATFAVVAAWLALGLPT
jgi:membrane-bound metal-dependent hydrolase YbcI (DUF457 family)